MKKHFNKPTNGFIAAIKADRSTASDKKQSKNNYYNLFIVPQKSAFSNGLTGLKYFQAEKIIFVIVSIFLLKWKKMFQTDSRLSPWIGICQLKLKNESSLEEVERASARARLSGAQR